MAGGHLAAVSMVAPLGSGRPSVPSIIRLLKVETGSLFVAWAVVASDAAGAILGVCDTFQRRGRLRR